MSELLLTGVELKRGLWSKCVELQTQLVNAAKSSMESASESALDQDSSTDENGESFKEQCHRDRDMYAIKFRDASAGLKSLNRINPEVETDIVRVGSIVFTNAQNLFISISLGQISCEGDNFVAISTQSPLYQSIEGKRKGDKFDFRGQKYTINEVF